jgi:hypothetical protein
VSTARSQTVELRLVETGTELWPAIEAAQYARLISHDPPESLGQERAIARFVAAFAACAETWDDLEPIRRSGALAGLSAQLDALERHGLFVHWAALDAGIAGSGGRVSMSLAILTISRIDLPTAQMRLPDELETDSQGGAPMH